MVFRVSLLPGPVVFTVDEGRILADVLVQAGSSINLYCGRRGVCGRCVVEILEGPLPPLMPQERDLLDSRGYSSERFRLACRFRIGGHITVRIPESSRMAMAPILSRGAGKRVPLDPSIRKIVLKPIRPTVRKPVARLDGLIAALGRKRLRLDPRALPSISALLSSGAADEGSTVVLREDGDIIGLEPGDTTSRLYGLAVDLGTTTIAIDLVDLVTGSVVETAVGLNGQASFGADVVSRIGAAFRSPEGLAALRSSVLDSLNGLIAELLARAGVSRDDVWETVVAGNTVMSHFFLGLPVDGLAEAPFAGIFTNLPAIPAGETGLCLQPLGRVLLSPNLQGFVGGDIAAGILAIDLPARRGKALFLDLGTNGEIVLKNGRRLIATSTAAGPAFEGMSISCGLPARPGAICRAEIDGAGRLVCGTIGGETAEGVCGTGLIDLISVFLRTGRLDARGRILSPGKTLPLEEGRFALTQGDVREIQLAAAAFKTGMRLLLAAEKMKAEELDAVIVAGAFGSFLDLGNAIRIGLLPNLPLDRMEFVGNASLAGARIILLSRSERRDLDRLPRRVRILALARDAAFQDAFVKALDFGPWPGGEEGPPIKESL